MRILILGNNYSQKVFYNYFVQDKSNIVFSSNDSLINGIDFSNGDDVVEFCLANDINFVLPLEEKYISPILEERLNVENITYFAPSCDAFEIVRYKSIAKKNTYKNNVQTPKFFIAEKPQLALDYIKNSNFPIAIHPDTKSYTECVKFAETHGQAQKFIDDLFTKGNKKIVLEDYVQGKNFTFWIISDGYSAKVIGITASYSNNVSYYGPEFLNEETKERIVKSIIEPVILNLSLENTEYVGILGFDVILNQNNIPYLTGFKGFFDDLSVDFFIKGLNLNWLDIFESCIKGDIFLKYEFKESENYMLAIRQNEKINFIQAKTKTNLKRYLKELEIDTKEYDEAEKIWKY